MVWTKAIVGQIRSGTENITNTIVNGYDLGLIIPYFFIQRKRKWRRGF